MPRSRSSVTALASSSAAPTWFDPHVEHAVVGGDPGQARAVGRDAGADPLGVAEQDLAGDEGDGGHGRKPRRSPVAGVRRRAKTAPRARSVGACELPAVTHPR